MRRRARSTASREPRPARLSDSFDVGTVRSRLVAVTGLTAALAAAALVLVVHAVLAGTSSHTAERVLADRADSVAGAARLASDTDRIVVPAVALDPGVAVYDAGGRRVAGTVPPSLSDVFRELSTQRASRLETVGESYSVLGRPFRTRAGSSGVVVVAEPLAPYERDEHTVLGVSLVAGLLMVLMTTAAAAWISRRTLAPVGQMAHTADEWSEHDLDRRFDLGPPTDEIRALGHTLDGLLEKVAHAIRAEQRLTGELAHELRTPLTSILGTAELIAMREDLDDQLREDVADIQDACRAMSATMTVLVDVARRQGADGDPRPETCTGTGLVAALDAHYRGTPGLTLDVPGHLRILAPCALVTRAIIPVVDNALQAGPHVVVDGEARDGAVWVTVTDDGPGIADDLADEVFRPGVSAGGSGLGLALARRVARSVGGDISVAPRSGPDGGARLLLRFPGADDGQHQADADLTAADHAGRDG